MKTVGGGVFNPPGNHADRCDLFCDIQSYRKEWVLAFFIISA